MATPDPIVARIGPFGVLYVADVEGQEYTWNAIGPVGPSGPAFTGYEWIYKNITLNTDQTSPQSFTFDVPTGKLILSSGFVDGGASGGAPLSLAWSVPNSGQQWGWGIICNTSTTRHVDLFLVVIDDPTGSGA